MTSSKRKYQGPHDLYSLQIADEWAPNTFLPQPRPLDNAVFPSTSQPYVQLVEQLSVKGHTELRYLRNELRRAHGTSHAERSRTSVLELSTAQPVPVSFDNSIQLTAYLKASTQRPQSRLYILEDISTNYVEAFGSHFSIEPSFWARHLRTTNWETSTSAGQVSSLPSMRKGTHSWSLVYVDTTYIEGPRLGKFRHSTGLFADTNLYRQVNLIQPGHFYDGIATVHRRASFWSRTNLDGTWDALILVDPPIGNAIYHHNLHSSLPKPLFINAQGPYQGGYTDLMTVNYNSLDKYEPPPRTSLYDDIIHYHLGDQGTHGANPSKVEEAPVILKRIVAGHWMAFIAYIDTSVSVLEYAVENAREDSVNEQTKTNSASPSYRGLRWLEEQLFHIYGWKRRLSRFLDVSVSNLSELNIVEQNASNLELEKSDWIYIKSRLGLHEQRSRDVVASALGLLSLVESHKSVEEAGSARIIAILATFYLPLSLIAGVLSMGGKFTPGEELFWVFFVAAIPMTLLSFVVVIWVPKLVRDQKRRSVAGLENE